MRSKKKQSGDDPERVKRALAVCDLCYCRRLKQNEIAARLGISQSTVTRDLEFALDRGFVRMTLHPPPDLETAQALQKILVTEGIRRVVLIRGSASSVGQAAARFFEEHAQNQATVVLDGGWTVSFFVESLGGGEFEGCSIVPIAADPPSYEISAYDLITRMAVKFRGSVTAKLPHLRGSFLDESRAAIVEKAKRANFVFLGTGPLVPGNTALDFVQHLGLSPEEVRTCHPNVACMCGYLAFDEAGRPIPLYEKLTDRLQRALEFDDLVTLAAGDCHVVLLASSEAKLPAVMSVIKARICNTLIVNDDLGAALLRNWRAGAGVAPAL
jgi:DNA-binding transcriptional regulator LsrR (DeoR family)